MMEALAQWARKWHHRLERREKSCLCCGWCCEQFGGNLRTSPADLERWRQQGREDLLCRVNRLGWIWIDPQTGHLEERCPFLERTVQGTAICSIHETKPAMCRAYPTLAHGRRCLRGGFLHGVMGVLVWSGASGWNLFPHL